MSDHSNFLMIVTPEWLLLPDSTEVIYAYGEESFQNDIGRGDWPGIEATLEAYGHVFPGKTLAEARMFVMGTDPLTRVQLWLRLVPLA